jgi:predicted nucleotidyltransferase
MRLSLQYAAMIRKEAKSLAGDDVRVRLFGSRVDDHAKGGDVDLLLELKHSVDEPAQLAAKLAARISRAMDGRKVDVLIRAPNLQFLPIHQIALQEGVLL